MILIEGRNVPTGEGAAVSSERDWDLFQSTIQQDFDAIQQKHHPFSVIGSRAAFECPTALEEDEEEEP